MITDHPGTESIKLDKAFLEQVEAAHLGSHRKVARDDVLFWQGDPVEAIYVVASGSLKEYTLLPDGRACAYRLLGEGGLAGATAYLLGHDHDTILQALDETLVLAMQPSEFDDLLARNPRFTSLLLRKLAQTAQSSADKARDLGFLDVQQRVMRSLLNLAQQHGIATGRGLEIPTELTHEVIGELVAANRSTITVLINKLQKQGLIWKHGRHWVVITPEHYQILDGLREAIVTVKDWDVQELTGQALAVNVDPMLALDALSGGMRQVERKYVMHELELADVIWSAADMKKAMNVIEARCLVQGQQVPSLGTVVFGTVEGDIHDLGKNIVSMFLAAHGFRVIDLGVDVASEHFVEAVRLHHPDILAMSALLTTTAQNTRHVIHALEAAGLRSSIRVIVGGASMTPHLAAEFGADGYAPDAREAAALAWRLMQQSS